MSDRKKEFRLLRWRPVQFLVYLILRSVVMVVTMFPHDAAPAIGRFLAWVLRTLDRKHVRIALKNVRASAGHLETGDPERFVRRVYRHLMLGFVEMLMIPRLIQQNTLERHIRWVGIDRLEALLAEGNGVIVTVGHLGSWEMIALAGGRRGYPLNSVARPIDNPWVNDYLNRFRSSTGQELISKYDAVGSMIRALKRKEVLVVQVDQDARHSGVYVKFFGRPASTHRSPAVLSIKYGAPIVPLNIYREGKLHYAVAGTTIRPEDYRDEADPVKAIVQEYTRQCEGFVRAHPDQWFWLHDRWKTAERVARVDAAAVV
ncbi:MAG TPA: lysophospholipid acyltransferase family protein [Planctomycetota bacterium]